jgi:hypothetical protein
MQKPDNADLYDWDSFIDFLNINQQVKHHELLWDYWKMGFVKAISNVMKEKELDNMKKIWDNIDKVEIHNFWD